MIKEVIFGSLFIFHSSTFCFSLGTFGECSSEAEVQHWMRYNIFLLLDVGTFSALVELLNMEIEYAHHQFSSNVEASLNYLDLFFATRCLSGKHLLTFGAIFSFTN